MLDTAMRWLRRVLRQLAPSVSPPHVGHAPLAERHAAIAPLSLVGEEELFAQARILEYVNDAAITIDPSLRILTWNRAAETIYGWPAAEVLERAVDEIIPVIRYLDGSSRADVVAAYERDGYWNGEVIQQHRDGHALVIAGTSRVVRDAHGAILAVLAVNRDITASRQAEDALRQSVQDYRTLFEQANDAILIFDPVDERILDVNRRACDIYRRPREAFVGRSLKELSQDVARGERYLRALLDQGHCEDFETVQFRGDGEPLMLRINASLIHYHGRPAVLSINRDITEAKRVEQALRESEERFRQLFERSPDGMFLVDPLHPSGTWPIVDCNAAAARMNGYSRAEILGQPIRMFSPTADTPNPHREHYEDLRRLGVLQGEDVHRRKDGSLVDIEYSTSLITLSGHSLILGIDRDITERKRAQQIVRESEERLRRLAEAAFEGIIIHDQGQILDANASIASMLGYERDALLGQQVLAFIAPEAWSALLDRIRGDNDQAYESAALRKDGSTFPIEIRSRPTPYQGRLIRVAAIRDLTERKQVEQERIALERKLLATQKLESLGVLAGGIAHDFNNLLAIILGNASLALLKLPPDSEVRRSIEAIKTAAQHGADLPRQMLVYAGKGPAATQPLDLAVLVASITDLLHASIGRNVTLQYQLAPALPLVEADPAQLRQVVLNLIINASEAIGEQVGQITLAIDTLQASSATLAQAYGGEQLAPGTYVRLRVSDTGPGMDAATQARIFEPFFTTKFIGRGLGLAVLLGIVRSHQGAVTVQSEPGQGATLSILLPAVIGHTVPPPAELAPRPERGSGTVLVIDDEEGVRRIAADLLERAGFTPLVAEDGASGVAVFSRHTEDIAGVLLDLTMPGMSSAEVFSALKRIRPDVPIVLMSGYPEQEVVARFGSAVPAGFLAKPFTATHLQETVMAALERAARRRVRRGGAHR